MARCSCSLLTLALLLALALDPASARRRRMLVRRKVASVPASNTTQPSGGRQPRPGRVVRRRLVPASPAPQLLAPAPPLPQHKPFTVNQTVAAKPDAVKRCEQCWNILIIYVMTVALLQSCPCSPSCPGSRAPAPPPPAPTAPATPATSAPASAAQPQVRREITLVNDNVNMIEVNIQNKTCSGTCASGFGVCCLVTVTCGGTTSVNGTYFQNPGYPSTYNSVSSCRLTINKCTEEVCQLRLDMDNMVLSQPETTDNQCQSDQFIISGGTPVPATCGTLTGSHSKN